MPREHSDPIPFNQLDAETQLRICDYLTTQSLPFSLDQIVVYAHYLMRDENNALKTIDLLSVIIATTEAEKEFTNAS